MIVNGCYVIVMSFDILANDAAAMHLRSSLVAGRLHNLVDVLRYLQLHSVYSELKLRWLLLHCR